MSRLAELEAMVMAAWTRGTQIAFGPDPGFSRDELRAQLAVYADELQQQGDPRGELIALDLERVHGDREQLVTDWLGPLATHPNVNTRYGLLGVSVTDTEPTLLADVLATRGAPYVSSVAIFGDAFTVRSTIVALARAVRPWLGALRIVIPTSPIGTTFGAPTIAPDLAAQLIEASPALYSLALGGTAILRDFPHPTLRRVVAESHEDFGPLAGVGQAVPAVTDLDLAFVRSMSASHWPAVRKLDLARVAGPLYRAFRTLPLAKQLTHVRLPSLRTAEERDLLQATLEEMPDLVHLEVLQSSVRGTHGLRHPRAMLVIPPSQPWPTRDDLDGLPRVMVLGDRELWVDLRELVGTMERAYASLPFDIQAIWDDFWDRAIDNNEFPTSSLATALEACPDGALDRTWRDVKALLGRMRLDDQLEGTFSLTMF